MREITATEMARNLRKVLDSVEFEREEIVVVRNHHEIARIIPGLDRQTALEAMAGLYCALPDSAAAAWLEDSGGRKTDRGLRGTLSELRDPWES